MYVCAHTEFKPLRFPGESGLHCTCVKKYRFLLLSPLALQVNYLSKRTTGENQEPNMSANAAVAQLEPPNRLSHSAPTTQTDLAKTETDEDDEGEEGEDVTDMVSSYFLLMPGCKLATRFVPRPTPSQTAEPLSATERGFLICIRVMRAIYKLKKRVKKFVCWLCCFASQMDDQTTVSFILDLASPRNFSQNCIL